MLIINAISKNFGATRALDGVSITVPSGQMVGLVGRSGAGKSTLLRSINRLETPSAGEITFEGESILALRGRAVRAWRARCAMIFQQFNLVNRLDVLSNVLAGRLHWQNALGIAFKAFPEADRARAARALERLGMLPFALQRAGTLSGGQQQRVAIARALVQEPKIVLADEPIASLDPMNAQLVLEALRRINREDGITVIASLHQVEAALQHCDRIIGLAHGRVVFDSPTAGLRAADIERIYDVTDTAEHASAARLREPMPA
ncbi:phosphonate ABC transporter ATP-binding protein [Falsiroseomonas sp.]|uniref:phosphonate ABC transporter ATP-binding protein n=1 Tax=Falsiroseomonas sp. TaxID=2870721 RepID=UPI0034A58F5C